MYDQIIHFGVLIVIGIVSRLIFVLSTKLANHLNLRAIYILIDFVAVGIGISIAGFAMIYLAHRVIFSLCLGYIVGYIATDICIDKLKPNLTSKHQTQSYNNLTQTNQPNKDN
ncbi:MAG: hypothetical protein LBK70_01740 [Clostridiales bacterium]|nr:hypothetical protein [Clostridiales bacterium]